MPHKINSDVPSIHPPDRAFNSLMTSAPSATTTPGIVTDLPSKGREETAPGLLNFSFFSTLCWGNSRIHKMSNPRKPRAAGRRHRSPLSADYPRRRAGGACLLGPAPRGTPSSIARATRASGRERKLADCVLPAVGLCLRPECSQQPKEGLSEEGSGHRERDRDLDLDLGR